MAVPEGITTEQGRPVPDQRHDEGVSMREQLNQSTGQLDQRRNDPRVANSPIFGTILDAFFRSPTGTRPDCEEQSALSE